MALLSIWVRDSLSRGVRLDCLVESAATSRNPRGTTQASQTAVYRNRLLPAFFRAPLQDHSNHESAHRRTFSLNVDLTTPC